MANELALTDQDVELFAKGLDAACDFFSNISEAGSNIIQSGINYFDKRAVEKQQLKIRELEYEEQQMRAQVAAYRAQEETNRVMINAQRDVEIERLNIPVKIEHEKTVQKQIAMEDNANELNAQIERLRITEQSKCLQHALDVALAAYTRKVDFYQAQLESCDNFFRPQIQAMQDEIKVLENKKDESMNDMDKYILISKRIDRLSEYCDKINDKYLTFHDNLTAAVKLAQLEAPDGRFGNVLLEGK